MGGPVRESCHAHETKNKGRRRGAQCSACTTATRVHSPTWCTTHCSHYAERTVQHCIARETMSSSCLSRHRKMQAQRAGSLLSSTSTPQSRPPPRRTPCQVPAPSGPPAQSATAISPPTLCLPTAVVQARRQGTLGDLLPLIQFHRSQRSTPPPCGCSRPLTCPVVDAGSLGGSRD